MKRRMASFCLLSMLVLSCGQGGSDLGLPSQLADDQPCIHHYPQLDQDPSPIDHSGYVTALSVTGDDVFSVKITWETTADGNLVYREPVNRVTLAFRDALGRPAARVTDFSYELVMDMGGRGHSTNLCPEVSPTVTYAADQIEIDRINFVMASRQPDRWFFYQLSATVDGVSGVIGRLNIPYRVK